MMRFRLHASALVAGLLLVLGQSAMAETVSIAGAVLKPGTYQWHPEARMHDATVAGQVRADAWFLGAALLRESAIEPQQRLKAGVLFDLRVNKLHARSENNPALLELAERLETFAGSLPVTGRVVAELNPFQLLIPQNNQLLQAGDKLVYPTRPTQIRVLGAVSADCQLAFDAATGLKDYLRQCPPHPTVDRNSVYVIQPDGQFEQVGIAHWNEQPVNLAVGALIYRPISAAVLSPDTLDLNSDMAELLATQYQLGGRFDD